ncbi:MAG TPA: PIN domain-containing protein [Thermoplasmata archaeon]|nr:PIN domain-containing protein [Thermoplasmata archaeon]
MRQYIDTGALIALIAGSDRHHDAANEYYAEAATRGVRFVLGRPVLVEFLDGVTKRISKREGIRQLHAIEGSARLTVEPDLEDDLRRGRELFLKYDDHEIDITDSLSFAIAERLGIKEVFTFDPDFAVHGFTVRP